MFRDILNSDTLDTFFSLSSYVKVLIFSISCQHSEVIAALYL